MKSTLLILPVAAFALFSSQPAVAANEIDIASVLERPEIRSLFGQLQKALGITDSVDEVGQPTRVAPAQKHEVGLRTSHLSASTGFYSAARGLTPADEWQQMFPRAAAKSAAR